MKKFISILSLTVLFAITATAQQFSATVTKRGSATIGSVVNYFNPEMVQYVYHPSDSTSYMGYKNVLDAGKTILIKTTAVSNDLAATINAAKPVLIPVSVVTKINNTSRDTAIKYYFPISKLSDLKSASVSTLPTANSVVYREENGRFNKAYLKETVSVVRARIDSLQYNTVDIQTYKYDTANYTMRTYDKHIVLNSTTADTLTLLNPNQFINRGPLVVANIGSGAYTLAGGFTVKDKSGSNVTSLTANTVYTFKAYYTGAAYIWLKEY